MFEDWHEIQQVLFQFDIVSLEGVHNRVGCCFSCFAESPGQGLKVRLGVKNKLSITLSSTEATQPQSDETACVQLFSSTHKYLRAHTH